MARQNAIREKQTRQQLLEEALRDKEETESREIRLREKLKKAGIDPDA